MDDTGWHRLVSYQADLAMDLLDTRGRLDLGQLPLAELMAPADSTEWGEWPGDPFYQPQTSRAEDPVAHHAEGIISAAQQVMRAMRAGRAGLALSSMWGLSVHLHDLQACADLPEEFAWPRWKHVRRGTSFTSGRRTGARSELYRVAASILEDVGPDATSDDVWGRLDAFPSVVQEVDDETVYWISASGNEASTSRRSFNNRLSLLRREIFPP